MFQHILIQTVFPGVFFSSQRGTDNPGFIGDNGCSSRERRNSKEILGTVRNICLLDDLKAKSLLFRILLLEILLYTFLSKLEAYELLIR